MHLSKAEKSNPDAETGLISISPRFSMTGWFWSRFFVIPNLFRDLCFWFRIWVVKPRPLGGVLYFRTKRPKTKAASPNAPCSSQFDLAFPSSASFNTRSISSFSLSKATRLLHQRVAESIAHSVTEEDKQLFLLFQEVVFLLQV